MDATLDISARHHLFQFMPAVSHTTDYDEHSLIVILPYAQCYIMKVF